MGTIIQQTAVTSGNSYSLIENAAEAGKLCIEQAGIDPTEIGLLINIGVNRDKNIMEPSIASLIQKDIGLGLDVGTEEIGPLCFSFDIVNGACGFLNAVKVAESYLKNGTTKFVLIVGGDCHPSTSNDFPEFPYVASGAAALLTQSDDEQKGFQFVDYMSSLEQSSKIHVTGKLADFGTEGRSFSTYGREADAESFLMELGAKHIQQCLQQHGSNSVDYLLASELNENFATQMLEQSELAATGTKASHTFQEFGGDLHTATPIAAFGLMAPQLKDNDAVLFSSVGSGNASACALYKV